MSTDLPGLEQRLDAVERTLTDGALQEDTHLDDLPDRAALDRRLSAVESRQETLEQRLDELDAATQAVRGYVGGVRAVNRNVERRADAALAAVDRLERSLAGDEPVEGSAGVDGADEADADEQLEGAARTTGPAARESAISAAVDEARVHSSPEPNEDRSGVDGDGENWDVDDGGGCDGHDGENWDGDDGGGDRRENGGGEDEASLADRLRGVL